MTKRFKPKRGAPQASDDTLVSDFMLCRTVADAESRVRVDRKHDVPYLGGSSTNGKIVYIDRHLPRTCKMGRKRVRTDPFLILHEVVEKALLDQLHLPYQHAHQIALRIEQCAVRAAGLGWDQYEDFMTAHVKTADDERLTNLPLDLELKPYRDEHDRAKLKQMLAEVRRQRRK